MFHAASYFETCQYKSDQVGETSSDEVASLPSDHVLTRMSSNFRSSDCGAHNHVTPVMVIFSGV